MSSESGGDGPKPASCQVLAAESGKGAQTAPFAGDREGGSPEGEDRRWMRHALALADRAAAMGEVPVGAVLIREGQVLGEGWNCPIATHDPSAHAEIRALRAAGRRASNYRLPGTTLYVTLEPCPMCASALVHARVARVVFGTRDPKGGACGSVFDLLPPDQRFNHRLECQGEVMAEECGDILRRFFQQRRLTHVQETLTAPEGLAADNLLKRQKNPHHAGRFLGKGSDAKVSDAKVDTEGSKT